MAPQRLSLVSISLLLLAGGLAFASAAAAAGSVDDEQLRITVHYPTQEESEWLDRWAEKYRAPEPGSGFSVQPATDEESAYLNRIFSDGKKAGARAGFDGHIDFENDRPIVVDKYHSSSSKPKDDLQSEEKSHFEEL